MKNELTFWNHSIRHLLVNVTELEKNKTRSQKLLKFHPLGIAGRGWKAYTVSLPNLKNICLEVCTIC